MSGTQALGTLTVQHNFVAFGSEALGHHRGEIARTALELEYLATAGAVKVVVVLFA
jgi:hypothetical protein